VKPGKRQVDRAMNVDRPEKQTVRKLWIEKATAVDSAEGHNSVPLYLTLSGAEGKDIDALIAAGLVSRADNNAIAEVHKFKVIAVEASPMAVLQLQRKFPGLKILEQSFQNIIHGSEPYAWPGKEHENYCRAQIINLDLNEPLRAVIDDEGDIAFPVLAWIAKLAQLHTRPPRIDWTLCLTLHGEILWDERACEFVQDFLADNFRFEEEFALACGGLLGADICEQIASGAAMNFSDLDRGLQQAILMVFVPKFLMKMVQHQGWNIDTDYNLRYGSGIAAPMVTWVCQFTWSTNAKKAPAAAYRQGLKNIFKRAGEIDACGGIIELS